MDEKGRKLTLDDLQAVEALTRGAAEPNMRILTCRHLINEIVDNEDDEDL